LWYVIIKITLYDNVYKEKVGEVSLLRDNYMKKWKIGIDGLDICIIMGVNKKRNAKELYLEKLSIEDSIKRKNEMSEADYWHLTIKDMIAKEFSIRSGKKVRKENNQLIDEEYDFMVGNIDRRIVGENSILICKSENAFSGVNWNGEKLPVSYILESQHYMRISRADKCYIALLIGGKRFIYKEILRDEDMITKIVEIEKDFWVNNVLKKVSPKVDSIYV